MTGPNLDEEQSAQNDAGRMCGLLIKLVAFIVDGFNLWYMLANFKKFRRGWGEAVHVLKRYTPAFRAGRLICWLLRQSVVTPTVPVMAIPDPAEAT